MTWKKLFSAFTKSETEKTSKCNECGEVHNDLSFSFALPALITGWSEEQLEERVHFNDRPKTDLIVVDEKYYFIRCVLEIPIRKTDDCMTFGVWQSQSEENFLKYQDAYFSDDRAGEETSSWHTTRIPGYRTEDKNGNLTNLASTIKWQAPPQRPLVYIHECNHPLYKDQKNGISRQKALKIAANCFHS